MEIGWSMSPTLVRHGRMARGAWALADVLVWVVALVGASWLRGLYVSSPDALRPPWLACIVAVVLHLTLSLAAGTYRRGQLRGSYEEIVSLGQTAVVVSVILLVESWSAPAGTLRQLVPGTVALIAGMGWLTAVLAMRLVVRALRARRLAHPDGRVPVVVFGAGSAGRLLVHNMIHDADSPYRPVALLDDDARKRGLRLGGLRVAGGRERIAGTAAEHAAAHLVIAVPSASATTMRELRAVAESAALKTLVLPPFASLLRSPRGADLRDINLEDLLGRRPVQLDEAAIADEIAGKVVLITGAGGSIGSELCRQVARFGARRLVMLDRDESALHSVQLDLDGNGLLDSDRIVLADIRDPDAVSRAFAAHRPDVVFHAAALKHLPLLQRYPYEAWQTNVVGTRNVLAAAAAHGVQTFVTISTDKAADPTSILGFSKRVAERLTAGYAATQPGRYLSVRFGNVIGSRGSVIPAFTEQIRRGGPVTVTHPDVERYFMLIPEACQLVLQAAGLGSGGEVMVLDMGTPVRIVDVARALIDFAGRDDLDIIFTGLRPGEKLTEDLFSAHGHRECTTHELITYVRSHPLDGDLLDVIDVEQATCEGWMRRLALGAGVEEASAAVARQNEAEERVVVAALGQVAERAAHDHNAPPVVSDDHVYLSKADVGPLEEEYVLRAMRSGYVAPLGPMVDEFEREIARRVGVKHALALSSGTAALHLALLELGAGPATYVVLPSMTFAASANAVRYTGATPVFVDSDPRDGNIDPGRLIATVDHLRAEGGTVAAVMVVDLFGRCADYTTIEPALDARGVPLIEDAAEALGASHGGRAAGSFGRVAAVSFNGNKIMTTSGGGMLLTDDGALADHARYLSTQARQPVPWYEHIDVGYNYRLSNVLAGLGLAQLERLDGMIARRRRIRDLYARSLAELPGVRILGRTLGQSDAEDNCWLTSVELDPREWEPSVDDIVAEMSRRHIECRHLWKPLHLQSAYAYASARPLPMPGSEGLFGRGLNLPSGSALRDDQVAQVPDVLRALLDETADSLALAGS